MNGYKQLVQIAQEAGIEAPEGFTEKQLLTLLSYLLDSLATPKINL